MKKNNTAFSVRDMVYTALFAAVLCAAAPFSIVVGPVPLSLATLVIYIASATLGWKQGALSVALYVTLGAIGLPVFANFEGGFHIIAGLTGGFIIGYIPLALATGLASEIFRNKRWLSAAGMVIGTVLMYTCGVVWFVLQSGNSLPAALLICVVPFLPGDTLKIIVAYIVAPKLRAAMNRAA
jgi:biotin transport system substrate-specific component